MSLKEAFLTGWKSNYYTCEKLYKKTTQDGNSTNRFSYGEFQEMTGITVQQYQEALQTDTPYTNYRYRDFVAAGLIVQEGE